MKVDDLKDLKELDAMFPNDPFEIYCYGEENEGKKKKGGKKKEESFKDSLHDLSKKELRKKAEEMGVDLRFVDTDSKKELRHAIMDARKSSKSAKKSKPSVPPVIDDDDDISEKKESGLKCVVTDEKSCQDGKPAFYFDMDTHDFVIHGADDIEDDILLDAMRSIGAIRREKRPKDGFGELMLRMDAHMGRGIDLVQALDPAFDPNVIEVSDYKVVDDDGDKKPQLPEGKKRHR